MSDIVEKYTVGSTTSSKSILDENVSTESVAADVLGIRGLGNWKIFDQDLAAGLALVHHDEPPRKEREKISRSFVPEAGHIRGDIVDTEFKCVVVRAQPPAPEVLMVGGLDETSSELELIDTAGVRHTFSDWTQQCKLYRGLEGFMLNVFYHNGKMWTSTCKRLDGSKSQWVNLDNFRKIYDECGGPQVEDLYDTTKKYGKWTHTFLVVHASMMVGSAQVFEDNTCGYVVLLDSVDREQSYGKLPYPAQEIDDEYRMVETTRMMSDTICEVPFVLQQVPITAQEANQFLESGFGQDGEFVVLSAQGKKLRLHSFAYDWRWNMRSSPDVADEFYKSMSLIYADLALPANYQKYMKITGPYGVGPSGNAFQRQTVLCSAWFAGTCPHRREEVKELIYQMESIRFHVLRLLMGFVGEDESKNQQYRGVPSMNERCCNILDQALGFVSKRRAVGSDKYVAPDGSLATMTYRQVVADNILTLLVKESSWSLRQLVNFVGELVESGLIGENDHGDQLVDDIEASGCWLPIVTYRGPPQWNFTPGTGGDHMAPRGSVRGGRAARGGRGGRSHFNGPRGGQGQFKGPRGAPRGAPRGGPQGQRGGDVKVRTLPDQVVQPLSIV